MKAILFVAVVVLALVGGATANATWKDCSSAAAHGKITSLTITPPQPAKGQNFTVAGSGKVDKAINSGKFHVQVQYNGISVFSTDGDSCKDTTLNLPLGLGEVWVQGIKCPLAVGPVTLSETIFIGTSAPSGNFVATFSAKDQDGEEDLCVQLNFAV